jgi:hypothetical protein
VRRAHAARRGIRLPEQEISRTQDDPAEDHLPPPDLLIPAKRTRADAARRGIRSPEQEISRTQDDPAADRLLRQIS